MEFLDTKTLTLVVAAVRKSFTYSLEYNVIKCQSKTDEVGPKGGKRLKCNICQESFGERDIKVDHIEPIVPLHKSQREMTLQEFYERCFCKLDNLQVLCKECHDKKSKQESKQRSDFRKAKKKFVKGK